MKPLQKRFMRAERVVHKAIICYNEIMCFLVQYYTVTKGKTQSVCRMGIYMKKQGIIFDMDGTLWDSAANVAESWNEAIRQDGRRNKVLTEADIKGVMGKTMDVIAKLLFPELSEKEQETLLAECCRIENDYLREHGGVLYPDLEDTFKELKKTYELYIVSNCQKGYIEAFLDHYHFWD